MPRIVCLSNKAQLEARAQVLLKALAVIGTEALQEVSVLARIILQIEFNNEARDPTVLGSLDHLIDTATHLRMYIIVTFRPKAEL
jgi:hypothetical protein